MSLFTVCLKNVPSLFIVNFSPLTASESWYRLFIWHWFFYPWFGILAKSTSQSRLFVEKRKHEHVLNSFVFACLFAFFQFNFYWHHELYIFINTNPWFCRLWILVLLWILIMIMTARVKYVLYLKLFHHICQVTSYAKWTTVAAVIYAFWRLTDISVLVLMACLWNQMRRSAWQVINRSITDPNGIINVLCILAFSIIVLLYLVTRSLLVFSSFQNSQVFFFLLRDIASDKCNCILIPIQHIEFHWKHLL